MNERDETNILLNSKFILEGIRQLNETMTFKEIKVYNDLDTSLKIEKKGPNNIGQTVIVLSLEDIVYSLNNYLTISEPNTLEYKA